MGRCFLRWQTCSRYLRDFEEIDLTSNVVASFFARQGDFWIRKCSEPVPFNGAKGLDSTQGTKEKQSGRNLKSEMLDAISQIAVAPGVLTSNVGKKVATALLAASAFQGTSTCLAASGSK